MIKITLIFLLVLFAIQISSIEWDLTHDITFTTTFHNKQNKLESMLNYKPKLDFDLYNKQEHLFDTEFSYDFNLSYNNFNDQELSLSGKLYRGWFRYSSSQTELRVGLQKINFGPAQILRSLQWFDSLDYYDPTQTTEGVKALLGRYYFLNNANIWLWGIWGDRNETSLDKFFSDENNLEFGSRIQYPFEFCDAALTFHHCKLGTTRENRFGFDARWDFIVGFWLEAVTTNFSESLFLPRWQKYMTLGSDYTISCGNGIYILGEYFVYAESENDLFASSYQTKTAAVSISYPLGLFDSIKAAVIYDWATEDFSRSLSYQRTYDNMSFNLNLLWNPEGSNSVQMISTDGISAQLMIVCNF